MPSKYAHVRLCAAQAVRRIKGVIAKPNADAAGVPCACEQAQRFVPYHARSDQQGASLLELTLRHLAQRPGNLTVEIIEQLSYDLAQLLLDALVAHGTLDAHVLGLFQAARLWHLRLSRYPGCVSTLLAAAQHHPLLHVDLSDTQVRHGLRRPDHAKPGPACSRALSGGHAANALGSAVLMPVRIHCRLAMLPCGSLRTSDSCAHSTCPGPQ